ncbi:helix-turn-helix transcriptional regulator [Streptomyces lavendulae]|uniref:helix-turn-helix transcriptional regulator n=1 Tax=Streptomyces lavendulae TaxID=1914 RepID=UPI0024A4CA0F|nr:hypothetical protein Sros01_14820 [Streptomyces roseochromogenus]
MERLEDPGELLKPPEVSKLLKVAVQTLANWRAAGVGPAYTKLSPGRAGRIRYRLHDVESWLDEQQEAA